MTMLNDLLMARMMALEETTWNIVHSRLNVMSLDELVKFSALLDEPMQVTDKAGRKLYNTHNGVAVIEMNGLVTKSGPGLCMEGFSTVAKANAVKTAAQDPYVHTIVLRMSSPGGTVDGTSDLADAVWEARQSKKVVAYASDLMASAAYWIGSQAEQLYANKTAEIGSIGVFQVIPDSSRAYENEGIKMHVVKSAPGKAAASPGTVVTEEQLAEFKRGVQDIHELFVEAVARGRGMKTKYQRDAAVGAKPVPDDGKCYIAEQALDMGLIDGIRSFDSLMSELSSSRPTMTRMAHKGERQKMNSAMAKALGLPEDATEEQIAAAFAAVQAKANSVDTLRAEFQATVNAAVDARNKEAIARFEKEQRAQSILTAATNKLGKITTAQTDAARKLVSADPDAFEAFVADLPATVPVEQKIEDGNDKEIKVDGKRVLNVRDHADRAVIAAEADKLMKAEKLTYDQAIDKLSTMFTITGNTVFSPQV